MTVNNILLVRQAVSPFFLLLVLLFTFTTTVVYAAPIQLYGLNYNTRQGPDWDWDKCKSYERIIQDLTMLKRITNRIRLLSLTDCGQGDMVLTAANALEMQVFLGLWVGPDHAEKFGEELQELSRLLEKHENDATASTLILGVSVGSEAIYREDASADELIAYMNQVYTIMQQFGYMQDKLVSICDIAPEYASNEKLRSAVNVTFTNTFPFWEATPIDEAIEELEADLGWLLQLPESSNKPFILGETGWPSDGFIEGVGIASPENQAQYFAESYCFLLIDKQWDTFWFTGINNDWRREQDPNNTIEGNFGILQGDLVLKDHYKDLEFTCSNGVTYSFAEMDWTIPTLGTAAPSPVDPASCVSHAQCRSLELPGMCCPTPDGVVLGCCDASTGDAAPSVTTVASPTTTAVPDPTAAPFETVAVTDSPTESTTAATTESSPVETPTNPSVTEVPPVSESTTNNNIQPPTLTPSPFATNTTATTTSPTIAQFNLVPVAVPGLGQDVGNNGTGSTNTSLSTSDGSLPSLFSTPAPSSSSFSLSTSSSSFHTDGEMALLLAVAAALTATVTLLG